MEAKQIPPTINVGTVNPKFKTDEWGFDIVQKTCEWHPYPNSASKKLLRAGINSFGYGGANGHVILENADAWLPEPQAPSKPADGDKLIVLPFSAGSPDTLEQRYQEFRATDLSKYNIDDLAYTLASRRTHLPYRGHSVVRQNDLSNMPASITSTRKAVALTNGQAHPLTFIFTGQGAQWAGMARELFDEFATFRDAMRRMDGILQKLPGGPDWTMENIICSSSTRLNEAPLAQPIATAIQIAIIELLYSWNIKPAAVIGHSSGEIAAAFAAGFTSADDAIIAAYYRGFVNGLCTSDGAMLAAGLDREHADAEIEALELTGRISVGCVNSPENVTVTGDRDAIEILAKELQDRGILARVLKTGGKAYHSHHMQPLGPKLVELLAPYQKEWKDASPEIRFMSTVTGDFKDSGFGSDYWRQNMESPVLFTQGISRLLEDKKAHFVEIGPHSTLELPLKQIYMSLGLDREQVAYSHALTRNQNGGECILNLAGRLHSFGHDIPFDKINLRLSSGQPRVITDLPTYPWTYKKLLWKEPGSSSDLRMRQYAPHELLGSISAKGQGRTIQWQKTLRLKDVSWLSGHKLEDSVIFPAAGYMAMVAEAAFQASKACIDRDSVEVQLRKVHVHSALLVNNDDNEIVTVLHVDSNESWVFEVTSSQNGSTNLHCSGNVSISSKKSVAASKEEFAPSALRAQSIRTCYQKLAEGGLNFGPDFQSIGQVQSGGCSLKDYTGSALAQLSTDVVRGSEFLLHPVILDALLQTGIISGSAGFASQIKGMVPTFIETATIVGGSDVSFQPLSQIVAHSQKQAKTTKIDAKLQCQGQVLVQFAGVQMTPYAPAFQSVVTPPTGLVSKVAWKPTMLLSSTHVKASEYANLVLSQQARIGELNDATSATNRILSILNFIQPNSKVLDLRERITSKRNKSPLRVKDAEGDIDSGYATGVPSAYASGYVSEDEQEEIDPKIEAQTDLLAEALENGVEHDAVVASEVRGTSVGHATATDCVQHPQNPESIKELLTPNGIVIASSARAKTFEHAPGYALVADAGQVTIFKKADEKSKIDKSNSLSVILVEADNAGPASKELAYALMKNIGQPAAQLNLSMVENFAFPQDSIIVSLLEAEQPLLRMINEKQLSVVRNMTDKASKLVWVTAGDLLGASHPDYSLASGISRSVMAEQPNLDFFTMDVPKEELTQQRTADNVAAVLKQRDDSFKDLEFIQRNGVLHVSRFTENTDANEQFNDNQTKLEEIISTNAKQQSSISRIALDPAKTYIVVGGTGGIGGSLSEWTLSRGARKVLVFSQSGRTNGYLKWKASKLGASLTVVKCDIASPTEVDRIISGISGEVGGVIHSAMGLCVG